MKPTQVLNLIEARYKANIRRPLFLNSSPGLGKTELAAQAAARIGVAFHAIHAPLLQPEDYGFPVINREKGDVSFIVSKEKFPVVGSSFPESGIMLIDELTQCDASSQKVLANLIHEREIHGQKLKDGWMLIATGNRQSDRSGASPLLRHLGNRVTYITLDASLDDWTQWALSNHVKPEVISFLRFRPELLTNFDPVQEISATPRAWVREVSESLGAIPSELEFETFKGAIGEGPAAEFMGFLKVFRKLPNPDAIILNPTSYPVPDLKDKEASSVLYALVGALVNRTSPDNFARILQYVQRMPGEFTALYVKDVTRCSNPGKKSCNCKACGVTCTKDFVQWASGPGAKLLI
jgi:hypothetical protein